MSQAYVRFLAILLTCLIAANVTASPPTKPPKSETSTHICNDEALKEFTHQLELLKISSDNTASKLDVYNQRLEHEFAEEKHALLQDIHKFYEERQHNGVNAPPPIDLRTISVELQQTPTHLYTSCAEAMHSGGKSGIYQLHLPASDLKPFYVHCLEDPQNGTAWTIVQRREDGSQDFYRDWHDYKNGFGNLAGEFFIGLEKLHALTHAHLQELWIKMEDFEGVTRFAKYEQFAIGDESQKYALNILGKFHGDAGDSLSKHAGHKFSTKDADNDVAPNNCAEEFTGAWWYAACHESNLNGQYLRGQYPKEKFAQGINWLAWHGHYYSLKYVHMAIRPAHRSN